MNTQDNLIEELGKSLGLNLNFDEKNQCLFFWEKSFFISIKKFYKNFKFYSALEITNQKKELSFLNKLLHINYMLVELDKGSIVVDPDNNLLMLVKNINGKIDFSDFYLEIQDFANSTKKLIKVFDKNADTVQKLNDLSFLDFA